jgi:hypothetical protein
MAFRKIVNGSALPKGVETADLGNKQDKVTNVSDTEISYLDGVTSNIQEQIDSKGSDSTPQIFMMMGA